MGFLKKEKTEKPTVKFSVQVVKGSFTRKMVEEICSAEFSRKSSTIKEIILLGSSAIEKLIPTNALPFSFEVDDEHQTVYVAYANDEHGVTRIDCVVVDDIDKEMLDEFADNKDIVRIQK